MQYKNKLLNKFLIVIFIKNNYRIIAIIFFYDIWIIRRKKRKNIMITEETNQPPDGKWGWMIVLAYGLNGVC